MSRWSWVFAFLGFIIGSSLSFYFGEPLFFLLLPLSLLFLFLSFKKRCLLPFLGILGIGIILFAYKPSPAVGRFNEIGVVVETKKNYFLYSSKTVRYYVYEKESVREVGDILRIEGTVSTVKETTYEGKFSFVEYLEKKGVNNAINPKKIEYCLKMPLRLREKELDFLNHFSKDTQAFLDSFLFSKTDSKNPFLNDAGEIGVLYFFSSTGLYLSFFLSFGERVLSYFVKEEKAKKIMTCFSLVFIPFSLGKVGILRIIFSRFFRLVKVPFPKEVSGLLLLLINPFFALSDSFLLGYLISYSLELSSYILKKNKKHEGMFRRFLLFLLLVPSFLSKGSYHLLSPFYSLILLPILFPFLLLGWGSFFSFPFVSLLNGYGVFLSSLISFLKGIDVSIPFPYSEKVVTVLYFVLLFVVLYLYDVCFVRAANKVVLISVISLSISFLPFGQAFTYEVAFINVGQGDSILIRDGFHSLLLDTGGSLSFDMAKEVLIPFLLKEKVYSLDYLVASHGDFDHIGAKDSLISSFRVGTFIYSPSSFPLKLGNVTIQNLNLKKWNDENENSLVLKMDVGKESFLFTGDAPEKVEKHLISEGINLSSSILKAGHHGSSTSTCEAFLDAVRPKEVVISVGGKNSYGHPAPSLINRLNKRNIKIRRTDKEGSIIYKGYSFSLPSKNQSFFLNQIGPSHPSLLYNGFHDPSFVFIPRENGQGRPQETPFQRGRWLRGNSFSHESRYPP